MIDDEFFLRNIETFKLDYVSCKICNGVIHHCDAKCRWCGSKKVPGAISISLYRLSAALSVLMFFFVLGIMDVSPLVAIPPGIGISYFFAKKYEARWLTKYPY